MKRYLLTLQTILVLLSATACSVNSLPPITPTVTLAPGMSRVTGVLQVGANGESQPAKNALLYLAETVKDSTGRDSFAALDRIRSPRTVTDDQGGFVFSNVPPGNYGLILDAITNSYLLTKPGSEEALLIEVSAEKQVGLGTLLYESLPLSPPPKPKPYPYP
jgi:hypothetical protein